VEICKVLEARDPDRAAAAMREHIAGALEFRL
jgi:DNA-binding GntR family transcriptional regulator